MTLVALIKFNAPLYDHEQAVYRLTVKQTMDVTDIIFSDYYASSQPFVI